MYDQLVKNFRQQREGSGPYAQDNIKFFSAVLAHYVGRRARAVPCGDLNYDGQLTNQHGIHSRFETELFLRYRDRLRLDPPALEPVRDPAAFAFDTLMAGFKQTHEMLQADLEAIGRGDTYDDGTSIGSSCARSRCSSSSCHGRSRVWPPASRAPGRPRASRNSRSSRNVRSGRSAPPPRARTERPTQCGWRLAAGGR